MNAFATIAEKQKRASARAPEVLFFLLSLCSRVTEGRVSRLQKAIPVATGPHFLQLSVQLSLCLQPEIPSQKALYSKKKWGATTVSAFLRPLLRRNQYCNLGCKKSATVRYCFSTVSKQRLLTCIDHFLSGVTIICQKDAAQKTVGRRASARRCRRVARDVLFCSARHFGREIEQGIVQPIANSCIDHRSYVTVFIY